MTESKLNHKPKTDVIKEFIKISELLNSREITIKNQDDKIADLEKTIDEYKINTEKIETVLSTTAAMKEKPLEALIAEKQRNEIASETTISALNKRLAEVTKANQKKQTENRKLKQSQKVAEETINALERQIEVEAGIKKRIEELEKMKSERCKSYEDIIQQHTQNLQSNEDELTVKLTESANEIERLQISNNKLREEIIKMAAENIIVNTDRDATINGTNKSPQMQNTVARPNETENRSPHGLPNLTGNLCCVNSPLHLLSIVTPTLTLKNGEGSAGEMILEVGKHLRGEKTNREAVALTRGIWEQVKTKWPHYAKENSNGTNHNQSDATEFLLQMVSELQEENEQKPKDRDANQDAFCRNKLRMFACRSLIEQELLLF